MDYAPRLQKIQSKLNVVAAGTRLQGNLGITLAVALEGCRQKHASWTYGASTHIE
jgi:hypothetical protein